MENRKDNYIERREKLQKLSDQELYDYFWYLTDQIVDPLIQLATNSTTPSIERSVLLRMGFSSIVAKSIVDKAMKFNLLGKGVGHLVLKYAEISHKDYLTAGHELSKDQGWDELLKIFNSNGNSYENR